MGVWSGLAERGNLHPTWGGDLLARKWMPPSLFLFQASLGLRHYFGAGQNPSHGRLSLSVNSLESPFGSFLALEFQTGMKEIEQLTIGSFGEDVY